MLLLLAAFFGVSNAYFALDAGITPNMAFAGTFLAAIILRATTRTKQVANAAPLLGIAEAVATGGNAAAVAFAFSLPALVASSSHPDVSWSGVITPEIVVVVALCAFAGISMGSLVSTRAVSRVEQTTEGGEGRAIRLLIEEVSRQLAHGQRLLSPAILIGLAAGIGAGLLRREAFSATATLFGQSISLGWNPAFVALGGMIGLGAIRLVFAGSVLSLLFGLASAFILAANSSAPFGTTTASARIVAAILLGLASLRGVFLFVKKGFAAKQTKSVAEAPARSQAWFQLATVASILAGSIAYVVHTRAQYGFTVSLATLGGILVIAYGSCFIAQRVVIATGVTLNPSSALSLLVAATLAAIVSSATAALVVPACAFVLGAASTGASLSQDLLIGRKLQSSLPLQAAGKWLASLFATICVAVLFWFVQGKVSPQASALNELAYQIHSGQAQVLPLLLLAAAAFVALMAMGVDPLVIAVGALVSLTTSSALLLGAWAVAVLSRRFALEESANSSRKALAFAVLAAVLGGYGVGITLHGTCSSLLHVAPLTSTTMEATLGLLAVAVVVASCIGAAQAQVPQASISAPSSGQAQ